MIQPAIFTKAERFSDCPQLAHIERNLFKLEPTKIPASNRVRILSAPSARAEVRFVAREILRLVKEENYRYRDIAVIASDIDSYQHYIRAYFADYGLPFFIDKRKALNQHPVVGLICSALQTVVSGFSSSDIFPYLKTALTPIAGYEVDMLENYCLAFGIRGSDWITTENWQFAPAQNPGFDETLINQIRIKVSKPLLALRDQLCSADNPQKTIDGAEFTRIVFDFLDNFQIYKRINEWIEDCRDTSDYKTADEHRQFYDKLINIFDELTEVFGGVEMTCSDYLAILNSAFSQMSLAFIPPSLDQILIGSIERSRHPNLKAVFLLGVTQKQFPIPISSKGILTDDDRIAAESVDFELAANTSQCLADRRYLAYIAFTRPSQFLCITYPVADDGGGAVPRSQFVANLESLFDDLNQEWTGGEQTRIEQVYSKSELSELLCRRLGRDPDLAQTGTNDNEQLGELLDCINSDEQLAAVGSRVVSAINYDNRAHLDKTTVKKLFAGQIKSSATRLSTFSACPYQHFARYVLKLREREEFKFEPLDLGTFYHRILDILLRRLSCEKKDFTIDSNELLSLLRKEIAKLITEDPFISNFINHCPHNAFVIASASENLEDSVLAIREMACAGSFEPALSEVEFGKTANSIGEYNIDLGGGRSVSLRGKIDRLDIADIGGKKIGLVFDYKLKEKRFSWSEFYYGLDMQLPLYILAIGKADSSKLDVSQIAGAFYIPIEVSPSSATQVKTKQQKDETFNHKGRGIFNGEFAQQLHGEISSGWDKFYNFRNTSKDNQYGDYGRSGVLKPDDFEHVLGFTEQKTVQLAEEIYSGKIEVRPYRLNKKSPCSYCKYKALCRFDWQINEYNLLAPLGKNSVLAEIKKTDG